MTSALLFGSIGVIAETSNIQRRAYNAALAEVGLDWYWDDETYRQLLTTSCGKSRLRLLADATATALDAATIDQLHSRKTEIACEEIVRLGVQPRPGVAAAIEYALARGLQLGLVTTTCRPSIDAIAEAAGAALPLERFDVVTTTDDVSAGKPSPECYELALAKLGIGPSDALAIEDTASSATAARAARIRTVVTPGALTDEQLIVGAEGVLPALGNADHVHPSVLAMLGTPDLALAK